VVHERRIGAGFDELTHDGRFGEAGCQPERRRAHQLGTEMKVFRRSACGRPASHRSVRISAAREQRADHRLVAPHDRDMQRGKPRPRGVGVGAALEQELDDVSMSAVGGQHGGADAPRICVGDVGSGRRQQLRRCEIADARGKHEGGLAAVRNRAVVFEVAVRRHRHDLVPLV
jgi:hypothetical protein